MSENPSLKNRILDDIKTAMKNGDSFARDTLRLLSSAIKQVEVDSRTTLDDSAVITILRKACKQREEASEQYQKAGRNDLFEHEQKELAIIRAYLPASLSDSALREELQKIIAELGAKDIKDLGKVMGAANAKLSAVAEGKRIAACAKEILGKG
ncbi:MAG: GatB/YqeY domain-containing protein [Helicobacter sp.]|nr:GatB/YqeY domain-containing protein [Helicobacter sp.]